MILLFILLLFYIKGALLEDEFDSDNFGDFYTVIPVLSEVKYPKSSVGVKPRHIPNYWDKFQTTPFKRHLKINESKEALQSENTKTVFDLLNKLNLSLDNNLVRNLILLGNKFDMNVSQNEEVERKPVWARFDVKMTDANILNSKENEYDDDDYDYKTKTNKNSIKTNQSVMCETIININEKETTFNVTTQTSSKKPPNIPDRKKEIVKRVEGIWFNGRCRCNYIFRSGCYKINPNISFIFFTIFLFHVF